MISQANVSYSNKLNLRGSLNLAILYRKPYLVKLKYVLKIYPFLMYSAFPVLCVLCNSQLWAEQRTRKDRKSGVQDKLVDNFGKRFDLYSIRFCRQDCKIYGALLIEFIEIPYTCLTYHYRSVNYCTSFSLLLVLQKSY